MTIQEIKTATAHRPWPLPIGNYSWYQEWNRLIFLHFRIDAATIARFIPPGLEVDTFDGTAWVSVVPFTMEHIRPRRLPPVPPISYFNEVNLRTYVTHGGKAGVYFFSLEADKWLSVQLAGGISGMPYEKAAIKRTYGATNTYQVENTLKNTFAALTYTPGNAITTKTAPDLWLTERYCVYLDLRGKIYRYNVHHIPWPLYEADIKDIQLQYHIGSHTITEKDIACAQYSPGVQVLAWTREML